MANDPAILFYTSDFLTGTALFDYEQIGKYIKLLCIHHQKGRLSEKDMFKICGTYDKDIFDKFKKDEEGNFYNERLELEIDKRKKYAESRRNNRLGKSKSDEEHTVLPETNEEHMTNTSETYVGHMENEIENVNESRNKKKELIPLFDKFWNTYGKQVDRKKCFDKFCKLSKDDMEKLFLYVGMYVESTPDKQFRKNPLTYLNGKCWEDMINMTPTKKPYVPIPDNNWD